MLRAVRQTGGMQTASSSNSDRSKFSPLELELASILWDWDPVGVRPGSADESEYDDLVRPLLIELGHGVRSRALAVKLAETMTRDYGLAMREQAARGVADRITAWWEQLPTAP